MRIYLILVFIIPWCCLGQQHTISGQVKDKQNQPLSGVNVFLEGSYDGAMTDQEGKFLFSTTLTGNYTLLLTAIGYLDKTIPVTLKDALFIQIILQNDVSQIEEVVVRAGQFRVGGLSNSVLSPLDIVTTAGSMGNIVAALEKLPGAQIAGENGRLMVRGGDPHEMQTYINGIRVSQPYSASANGVPVRGRFSPFLFKGTNFSTGAYSAEYGNALSSILNMNTSFEIENPKTELSFSSVGLGLSNTQQWGNTSLSLNSSYTNLAPYTHLIRQGIIWTKPYEQWSGEGILRSKGRNNFLNVYGSFALENLGFEDYHVDYTERIKTAVRSKNIYLNGLYTSYLPNNWKWDIGTGLGYMIRDVDFAEYNVPNTALDAHLKSKWQKNSNSSLKWLFGAEYFHQQFDERIFSEDVQILPYGFRNNVLAGFSEVSYRFMDRFYLDLGLRYTDDLRQNRFIEPRAALAFQIDKKQTASFSYGLFHQQAQEDVMKYVPNIDWQAARHHILHYSYTKNGKYLRLELYRKDYERLVRYNTNSPTYYSDYSNHGNGKVQGIDLFWKDNTSIRNLQYWISYSHTDAKKFERNYPLAVRPTYVADQYFSVVTKYWVGKWRSQVGLTNTFISGRPYHNPNLDGFMQSRTESQNDMSFNWSFLLTQQKIIHFSMTNILGNEPVFGYNYSQQRDTNGIYRAQAVTPTAKRFVFIGFFWTISQNKRDNQLDNL